MIQPMTNVDNFWLCMDSPTNLMVISGFLEFEEAIEYDRLRETLESRLLCFDRFKQRVVKPISGVGVPNWETDIYFDIRSHLHRIALPSPGNKTVLKEMISDLMTEPLDHTRPLWQVHLIENYESGCVVFFRLHHCIADGIALIKVLLSMADTESDSLSSTRPPSHEPFDDSKTSFFPFGKLMKRVQKTVSAIRSTTSIVVQEFSNIVSNPLHAMELLRTGTGIAVDTSTVLAKLALMPSEPKSPFKGKLGVRKRVAWTNPMPIKDIKVVGRAVDATLNDVLIGAVTGALRRYLIKRQSRVNDIDLRAAVPVNIRKPGTEFELGNKFSLVFLSLPVHIEDPVLRLKEVKRRMDNLKKSPDAFVGFQILNALGLSPARIAKRAAQLFANKATAVLTNVPGPKKPLYFAGKKIANMMFWVPRTGNIGLGISIFSYDNKVTVGVACDEKLVPDPETILEGFEDDFNHLLELAESGKIYGEPLVLNDRSIEKEKKDFE